MSAAPGNESEAHTPLLAAIDARRGDLCCYLVYVPTDPPDARATSLLAKAPRFTPRKAIERAEAMGVERVTKVSA